MSELQGNQRMWLTDVTIVERLTGEIIHEHIEVAAWSCCKRRARAKIIKVMTRQYPESTHIVTYGETVVN